MSSPKINERYLHKLLSDAETALTPAQLRYMSNMVLLDAHVRGVTLEFMLDVINECSLLQSELAEIEAAVACRTLMYKVDPERPLTWFEDLMTLHAKNVSKQRNHLAEKMTLLMQCRGEEDAIN